MQNVMPVSNQMFSFLRGQDLGALKLTINQFYRVNGDSTQNRGVRSDIVLPSLIDNMDLGESFLDDAMEFDKTEVAQFAPVDMVSQQILKRLQQASTQRVVSDKDFKETQEEIDKYLKKKNQKTISPCRSNLVEKNFRTTRKKKKRKRKKKRIKRKPTKRFSRKITTTMKS